MYKSCGCDYGSCDCGVDYSKEEDKAKVHKFMSSLIPQDLYLLKAQNEVLEYPRHISNNNSENVMYIGLIDEDLSLDDIMNKMNALEAFMEANAKSLSNSDKIMYLSNLGRQLSNCVPFKSAAVTLINDTFDRRYQRVVSDWMKVF